MTSASVKYSAAPLTLLFFTVIASYALAQGALGAAILIKQFDSLYAKPKHRYMTPVQYCLQVYGSSVNHFE